MAKTLNTVEIFNLKDTDELKIFVKNKEFHIHWRTLKTLIGQQVVSSNNGQSLASYLEAILVDEGTIQIGGTDYSTVLIPALVYLQDNVIAEGLSGYTNTSSAESDGNLPTGSLYYITSTGAVYRKLT
jgi:hypothetical protein